MTLEKGTEVIMVDSKEKNDEGESITCRENDDIEFPKVFPLSFLALVAFYPMCRVKSED